MFCKFHFAAMWDSFDVAAQGDCSSAVKPKVELIERMVGAVCFSIFPYCCICRFCGIFSC